MVYYTKELIELECEIKEMYSEIEHCKPEWIAQAQKEFDELYNAQLNSVFFA